VLHKVSLKVEKGQIVGLIGANGAGKSTCLKTITGILKIQSGRIIFNNRGIHNMPPHEISKLGITLVPEGRRIFTRMTVRENLLMGAYLCNDAKEVKERLKNIYQLFPILREREKQLAGRLSGGEQQMLALGRAFMSRPQLLILDEPSLGLAPKIVMKTFETIKKFNDEEDLTILLSEQNVLMTFKTADHIYVMENGSIVMEGPPDKLRDVEEVVKKYLGV
jgi:branched-chain amino acid transport system ATP-binding protein